MSAAALTSLAVVAVPLLAYIYKTFATNPKGSQPGAAYILENTVIHARLLPAPSTHAFTYPTLAFLLSLNALETHALDLGRGWLFGYGGTAWRLTGLRNGAYLLPDSYNPPRALSLPTDGRASHGVKSLKAKLAEVLVLQRVDERRVQQWAKEGDAWMLTMPSYVGYEGINPLTVYFCYASEGTLEWIVLEIHNTFGEKHVHVLEPGLNEDIECPPGYDYTWTLPRDFHVSPFNDRSGFYTISVSAPPPPLSPLLASSPPRPKIRIHLRTAVPSEPDTNPPTPGALKLAATLFARRAVPLTTAHLLRVLARYPFALLLSLARILYHAGILHYMKRLDVFPRPDPKPSAPARHALEGVSKTTENGGSHEEERVYGGIGWQPEGALEAYARKVVESFLARRAEELEIRILLVSGDPSIPPQLFPPSTRAGNMAVGQEDEPDLTICYAAPRFFTTLLLAPSSSYMLLLGHVEDLFRISSASLFSQVFSAAAPITQGSLTQRLRVWLLPPRFVGSASPSGVPLRHPLDGDRPLMNAVVICAMHLMDNVEKVVFTSLKARFVPGLAPWQRWERAARMADEGRT